MTDKGCEILTTVILILAAIVCLAGCTSVVTHYDENGKITKVEEVTNFSRAMDGTNSKSQMILVDGTYIGFEASATAGDNCTPGIDSKFARGKIAFINEKDEAKFNGSEKVVKEFFASKVNVSSTGVKTE